VLLAGLAYWLASLLLQEGASWAEIVLYRPKGDNQVYPVIAALSQLNLGDPTDAVVHGRGVAGFQVVILLPYALACAILGPAGYMVADAVLSWVYFVGVTLFLRRCGAGPVAALWVGAALATNALPLALRPLGEGLRWVAAAFGRSLAEWDFPNLASLLIFEKRIPRPMVTEVALVFLFYFLVRQWRERTPPSLRRSLALGFLMALLVQGDPYSFSAAGLVLLGVLGVTLRVQGRRGLGRCVLGGLAGALAGGAYFLFQLWHQDPEAAVRFGLAPFPRARLMLLPGYGPWLRLAAMLGLVFLVRHWTRRAPPALAAQIRSLSAFALVLTGAGWLAQPLQLLLLGKGAQIYHFFYFTFPAFYAYALVVVFLQLGRWAASEVGPWHRLQARLPGTALRIGGAAISFLLLFLPLEADIRASRRAGTARAEISPWAVLGDAYRPGLRELDRRLREDARLRAARTFGTFSHEANFLLAGFHGKRALLPDNAYSTLSDAELEQRLFQMARLLQFSPEQFTGALQNTFLLNYWLGCAKYWCADDHKFAPESDYAPAELARLRTLGPLPPFNLVLPLSELRRLVLAYRAFLQQPLDAALCPDLIVLSAVLWSQGAAPPPGLYQEVHRDGVFAIYLRTPHPSPSAPGGRP
jgi:hypothetical protein